MNHDAAKPAREDVLYAYAIEPHHDRETLEVYLDRYPELTRELLDLSRELSTEFPEDTKPLSEREQKLIHESAKKLSKTFLKTEDVFALLDLKKIREIVKVLGIPQQVLTALRERKVIPDSIPSPFLERLALAIGHSVSDLRTLLSLPAERKLAVSFKASDKPQETPRVSFEELLIQAGVPDAKRAELLSVK